MDQKLLERLKQTVRQYRKDFYFPIALQKALDYHGIHDPEERETCAAALGRFFGRRGAEQKKRLAAEKKQANLFPFR